MQGPDDEVRRDAFVYLLARLTDAADRDPAILVQNHQPTVFALSRHGSVLTVVHGQGARLLRGELTWRHAGLPGERDAPWRFSVSRAVGPRRLQITPGGPTGSPENVLDNIVETFLSQT